jgi:PAS domain S-box-containing protein
MNKKPILPKIDKLRRNQRIVKRQIEFRTAALEKTNESLQAEITRLKRIEKELKIQLQERSGEVARANEALLAQTSERARAEESLREREAQQIQTSEFNYAVMANMGEGLYTLDTRGLATYINPAAERLFGWSSAELIGRKMHDVMHYRRPDGRPFPVDECPGLRVLQIGTILSDHEDVFIRKDGTFFPVVCSSSPIRSDDGGIVGWLWSFGT